MCDHRRDYSYHATKLFLTHHSNTKNNDPSKISDKMSWLLGNSEGNDPPK